MSFLAEHNAIIARFVNLTTIATANQAWDDFGAPGNTVGQSSFKPPTVDPSNPSAAIWARLSIQSQPGSGRPACLGANAPRVWDEYVTVQHFAPAGMGIGNLLSQKVDETLGIFSRKTIATGDVVIRLKDADPPMRVPLPADAAWQQINVTVPFSVFNDISGVTGATEGATVRDFTQASHGFSLGTAVYRKSDSTWALARANASGTLAHGVAVRIAGDAFTVGWGGFHGFEHGLGSTPADIYLSQSTAGLLTTTAPTSGWYQRVGRVIHGTLLLLNVEQGQFL